MVGVSSRTPSRQLFKELHILTLVSLYTYNGSYILYKKTPPVCRAKFKYSYLQYSKEDGYSHPVI